MERGNCQGFSPCRAIIRPQAANAPLLHQFGEWKAEPNFFDKLNAGSPTWESLRLFRLVYVGSLSI